MTSILFILSSHSRLGSTGQATGAWLEELAAPYWVLVDAGIEVRLASPQGGAAPLDPMSVEDPWITEDGRRFLDDSGAKAAIAATARLDELADQAFDGVYLVGGSATTWDFPHSEALKARVEAQFAGGGVIGAICHGVIGLVRAVDAHGEPIVKNRQLTGISDAEDAMMGLDKIVPVLPETMLRKLRALYSSAAPLAEHVVCDPPFITGQNPASAKLLGEKILQHVQARTPTVSE